MAKQFGAWRPHVKKGGNNDQYRKKPRSVPVPKAKPVKRQPPPDSKRYIDDYH